MGSSSSPATSRSPTLDRCVSCGAPMGRIYCPECGERRLRDDEFSLRRFVADALRELLGGETSRLRRSVQALALKPGRLTREYIRGRRRPYLKPLQLFLLANLVYFVAQPFTGYNTYNTTLASQVGDQFYSDFTGLDQVVDARVASRELDYDTYSELFDLQSHTYARSLVILMVPLLALVLSLLLFRTRRPFTHHLIFALHYYAWELVFITTLFLTIWGQLVRLSYRAAQGAGVDVLRLIEGAGPVGGWFWFLLLELPTLPFIGVYIYLAVRRVYELARLPAAASAAVLTVVLFLITLVYRFILFWVTFATV